MAVFTQIWPNLDPEAAEPVALLGKLPSDMPLPSSAACTDGHCGASTEDVAKRSVQRSTELSSVNQQCRRTSRYVTAPPITALGAQVVCHLYNFACLRSLLWCCGVMSHIGMSCRGLLHCLVVTASRQGHTYIVLCKHAIVKDEHMTLF